MTIMNNFSWRGLWDDSGAEPRVFQLVPPKEAQGGLPVESPSRCRTASVREAEMAGRRATGLTGKTAVCRRWDW